MESAVQHVVGLLLRSRLLTTEEAKRLYQRWLAEAKPAVRDGERFTQWLVANQYLTEYQATLLARGHTEGFFLGEYKILERLGRGQMAGVYKAVDRQGQRVAIKVLPPSKARAPQLLARFQREAQLALRLQHPHVVRALQSGVEGGHHYLVMESLEGETLNEVLKQRGPLAPLEAVQLLYQALLGLQHLYEQGLVHRDLKPGNLMLVPTTEGNTSASFPTVKILDLGLGRAPLAGTVGSAAVEAPLASDEVLLGTPDYRAPEQARDARTADIRADLYSLGCVLYHALTGRPPFPDANRVHQVVRHATEPPRPLRELNPALPESLQPILDRLLAKDPAQRYATPAQAALALQTWFVTADGRRGVAVPDPPVPAAQPRREEEVFDVELVAVAPGGSGTSRQRSRRDLLMLALGGASVLLAIFLGWLLAQLVPKKELGPAAPERPEADLDKDS